MQLLKERIIRDGKIGEGNILKVDSFLNHQMDIRLFGEIGKEFRLLHIHKQCQSRRQTFFGIFFFIGILVSFINLIRAGAVCGGKHLDISKFRRRFGDSGIAVNGNQRDNVSGF